MSNLRIVAQFPSRGIGFLLLILFFSGCSILKFWGEYEYGPVDNEVRAYFVDAQPVDRLEVQEVSIQGNLDQVLDILNTSIYNLTSAPTEVYRFGDNVPGMPGQSNVVMEVSTSWVLEDSLSEYKKFFRVGKYIMEDPRYEVTGDYHYYKIQSEVKRIGINYHVNFSINGKIEWNGYFLEKNKKDEIKRLKVAEKYEKDLGVGEYLIRKDYTEMGENGIPVKKYSFSLVEVNDQPKTTGVLETDLVNMVLDQCSVRGIKASVNRR